MQATVTLLVIVFAMAIAVCILRPIDKAARNRREKFKFVLVDLFSLLFLIQLPLAILGHNFEDESYSYAVVAGALMLTMLLVWWTTVRVVSQAGIQTTSWRALISLIVIPATYIGSFALIANVGILVQRENLPGKKKRSRVDGNQPVRIDCRRVGFSSRTTIGGTAIRRPHRKTN